MNQRVMGPRYWMVLVAAVVLAFVPGTASSCSPGPCVDCASGPPPVGWRLSSIQSLVALALLIYMLYFGTSGLNPFLFIVELTCLVLGASLTTSLVRVSAFAYARPGFGFDPQLRATASGTPIPTPPPAHTR